MELMTEQALSMDRARLEEALRNSGEDAETISGDVAALARLYRKAVLASELRSKVDAAEAITSDVITNGYGEDVEMLAHRISVALSDPPAKSP
jgi:hypothetical protein